MGRKSTKNTNMPPRMRPRVKSSGKTYYYFDMGGKPRKEIPLGCDYILALRKYTELAGEQEAVHEPTFEDLRKKYVIEEMPKKADSTQRVQTSDMKHLDKFFNGAPLAEIKPMHVHQFLQDHKNNPTTANRCKRLFSAMWNQARAWGYTDSQNPCEGIRGFKLGKREVYTTDAVFKAVWSAAGEPLRGADGTVLLDANGKPLRGTESTPLRDAMDLVYLTGQRPGDALKSTEHDIADGHLSIKQGKTKQKLRIAITGELATLLARIRARKATHKIVHTALLVNKSGRQLTKAVLRDHFEEAREVAAKEHPELADAIKAFWFYDLRAKAADDTAESRGEKAASELLGHDSVKTTQRHYLRQGKKVSPTK